MGLATIINGLPSQKDDPHTFLSELASSASVSAAHTHPHLLNQSLFHFSSHLLFPFHSFKSLRPLHLPEWVCVYVSYSVWVCVCFGASFGPVTCRDVCLTLQRLPKYLAVFHCPQVILSTKVCVCEPPGPMQAICLETGHAYTHMHTNPQLLICVCTVTKQLVILWIRKTHQQVDFENMSLWLSPMPNLLPLSFSFCLFLHMRNGRNLSLRLFLSRYGWLYGVINAGIFWWGSLNIFMSTLTTAAPLTALKGSH